MDAPRAGRPRRSAPCPWGGAAEESRPQGHANMGTVPARADPGGRRDKANKLQHRVALEVYRLVEAPDI
eukprot:9472039-Pyramimonas_sp.AAC.1